MLFRGGNQGLKRLKKNLAPGPGNRWTQSWEAPSSSKVLTFLFFSLPFLSFSFLSFLFFFNSFMQHNPHAIKLIPLNCTVHWLLVYSQSCTPSIQSNFRTSSHLPEKPCAHQQSFPISPQVPLPRAATNLLSVSTDLPNLGILYSWNYTTWSFRTGFFHLA